MITKYLKDKKRSYDPFELSLAMTSAEASSLTRAKYNLDYDIHVNPPSTADAYIPNSKFQQVLSSRILFSFSFVLIPFFSRVVLLWLNWVFWHLRIGVEFTLLSSPRTFSLNWSSWIRLLKNTIILVSNSRWYLSTLGFWAWLFECVGPLHWNAKNSGRGFGICSWKPWLPRIYLFTGL